MSFNSDIQRQVDVLWTEQEIDEIVNPNHSVIISEHKARRDAFTQAVRAEMDEQLWDDSVKKVVQALPYYRNRKAGVCLFAGRIDLAAQERGKSAPFKDIDHIERSFVDRFGFPQWAGKGPSIETELRFKAIARLVQASPISTIWRESDPNLIERQVEKYYWEQKKKWEEKQSKMYPY